MDYKKKSLNQFNCEESYEEIDTRLATGWYVKTIGNNKKKKYKTKEVSFKISKIKSRNNIDDFVYEDFELINYEHHPHIAAKVAV